jgi:hypothetical protein|uniref:Uncharacterized protein n=1 Tax=Sipha flava TaxID=143950 RepID=A0A2S2PY78_9HEMI
MAVSWIDVTTISNCLKKAWNIRGGETLSTKIPINKDINDEAWNKLLALVPISNENTFLFSSFILLDNDFEICDESAGEDKNPEISAKEPTEPPVDKPSRVDVMIGFDTRKIFPNQCKCGLQIR